MKGSLGMSSRFLGLIGLICCAGLALPLSSATSAEPARSLFNVDYNLDRDAPQNPSENQLDLYLPAENDGWKSGLRPVVVWVHGGGFIKGDKSNRMPHKVRLFNDLGYIVASVNYRLSPDISINCCDFSPSRVRAPDHISDVAEAVAWISRNIRSHGGDPDSILLVGHSAGAQLVSLTGTSPRWINARKVSRGQILGAVSLDTDTFNVREEASQASPLQARMLAWNAFGTPDEEAVMPRWDSMSPLLQADSTDPPFLFVTQAARPGRMAANQAMARSLGQDPGTTVVGVSYDHEGINTNLGSPTDTSVETGRVKAFLSGVVSAAKPAGVTIKRRPAKRVTLKRKRKLSKLTFAFRGTGRASGFQCRINRKKYSKCRSPRSYRMKKGSHTFRVRALFPSGRPGNERTVKVRIVTRARN